MVNANDPAAIPYVIQEGALWYVAYKEKNPYVPYITVSAKGVANGLSTEYNDGYDFGPDSYNPSVTSGVPLTQTSGIQEAMVYALANNISIQMSSGIFDLTNATIHSSSTGQNPYIIGITGSVENKMSILEIRGTNSAGTFTEALASSDMVSGTIIYCGANTTALTDMIQIFSNGQSTYPITLKLSDITLRTHEGAYTNALNCEYAASLYLQGIVNVDTDATVFPPTPTNSYGIIFPLPATSSYSSAEIIIAQGYTTAVAIGPHAHINILLIDAIINAVSVGTSAVTSIGYASSIEWIDIQYCATVIVAYANVALHIGGITYGDGTSSQSGSYANSANNNNTALVHDVNGNLYGDLLFIPYPTTGFPAGPNQLQNVNALHFIVKSTTNLITQTTVSGTTAGSFIASEPISEPTYKKVIIYLDGYENDTTTAQTYTFPVAFSTIAEITSNTASVPVVSTSLTEFSIAPDTTTAYTGIIVIEGY